MTRYETKQALNAILEAIGSRGLSGIRIPAHSVLEALAQLEVFPDDAGTAERRMLVANLRRQGLVEITKLDGFITIQPSVKGIHRLQRAQIQNLFVRPQDRWDGTWRMVSYDIPARYGKQRRLFTAELHRLGFTLIKDSTWFHPYPCFDALSELVAYCGLTNHVMVAEIARIDEGTLRRLYKAYPSLRS
jgi:phenylacetic acid degradation operon negative regulatory protein